MLRRSAKRRPGRRSFPFARPSRVDVLLDRFDAEAERVHVRLVGVDEAVDEPVRQPGGAPREQRQVLSRCSSRRFVAGPSRCWVSRNVSPITRSRRPRSAFSGTSTDGVDDVDVAVRTRRCFRDRALPEDVLDDERVNAERRVEERLGGDARLANLHAQEVLARRVRRRDGLPLPQSAGCVRPPPRARASSGLLYFGASRLSTHPRGILRLSVLSDRPPWPPRLETRPAARIAKRKTFAIISHPDAGKTTLTEKLLLYGGAIQLAGAVKAKRGAPPAVSDWMEMEQERGISIASSVLQFAYRGLHQPGRHARPRRLQRGHLPRAQRHRRRHHAPRLREGGRAADQEALPRLQERKLPIFTFVNKIDRPGASRFDSSARSRSVLGIGVYPITWPIYSGGRLRGVYHRAEKKVSSST